MLFLLILQTKLHKLSSIFGNACEARKWVAYLPKNKQLPLWRNRLARSAVNRKVGGSNPPMGAELLELLKQSL